MDHLTRAAKEYAEAVAKVRCLELKYERCRYELAHLEGMQLEATAVATEKRRALQDAALEMTAIDAATVTES